MALASKLVKLEGTKIFKDIPAIFPNCHLDKVTNKSKSKKEKIYQIRLPEEILFLVSSSKKNVKEELSKVLSKKQMKSITWITCVK